MKLLRTDKIETNLYELEIRVEGGEFKEGMDRSYQKNVKKLSIPGFRKGKAPRAMVMKMVGEDYFYEDAVNMTYSDAYDEALKEAGLEPVDRADVELKEVNGEGYTFVAKVTVRPEVALGDYKGLEGVRPYSAVEDGEVQGELDRMADRNSRLIDVDDRPAADGDTTEIDFEGFLDGVAFPGGKGEKYTLVLGSHQFIPGFEEQIVGHSVDEEFEIGVKFPEDYHEETLKGKDTTFKIKLLGIKKKEVPALDDEFAKDVSEFDTLDELKADLEKQIREDREKDVQRGFEDALMEQVAQGITAEIPDARVEGQARQFVENFRTQIAQQGIPYDQYLQMTGIQESKLLEDAKEPALRQVRMDLAVMAIIKAENIEASDEDVEEEYKKLAEQFGMDAEMVKKYIQADQVKDQVCSRRAIDVVVESATAVKPEEKPEEKPAEEPAAEEKKPARKPRKKKTEESEGAEPDAEEKKPARKPRKKKTEETEEPKDAE